MERTKNSIPHIPFLAKAPKIGSNKPKRRTVRIALPKRTFSPKPIGNIWIKGAMIIKAGILKTRFSILLDLCVIMKIPNINRPK